MSMLRSLLPALMLLPVIAGASSLGEPRVRGGWVSSPPVAYGNHVYAASGISVEVWDVTNAAHPQKTALPPAEHTPGLIFGLAIRGDFLYVGWANDSRTTGGFQIYSLADPAHPARAGDAATMHADALLVNGDFLYEVDGQLGITAIDASDPLHPAVAGAATATMPVPQNILAAQIAGDRLYASGSSAFENSWGVIFDLADPAHPLSVGEIALGAFGVVGAVSESGYALAFGSEGGIYDVRDPAHVALAGALPPGVELQPNGAVSAAFRGDDLYLFGGDTLPVYDLSTPSTPALITQASIGTNNLYALTPLASGFLATTLTGRAFVVDASSPSAPAIRGEIALPSSSQVVDAALGDGAVYAIGEGHALEVIDAASLDNIGILDAPADDEGYALGTGLSVGLSGTTAIIGGYRTIFAVDVGDRTNPAVVGSLPLDYYGPILVAPGRAYVPTNDGALTVIDVADPTAPAVRGSIPGYYAYRPLATAGSLVFAYATDPNYGPAVQIVDAQDASHPLVAGSYVACIGSSFDSLAVSGDGATLAAACADARVELVDTRDPSAAMLVGTYRPAEPVSEAGAIAANGTTFYLGNAYGIDEVDASDPSAPAFVVRHPTASWVQALRMAPNGSLLALTMAGMYVFDCTASGGGRPLPCRDGVVSAPRRPAHARHASER